MKVAVVGSRTLRDLDLAAYIPPEAEEIITGGAYGIDTLAEQYANSRGIPVRVFRPAYDLLGKWAPLARNDQIVDAADLVVAVWDGVSTGTRYTINRAQKLNKPVKIYVVERDG